MSLINDLGLMKQDITVFRFVEEFEKDINGDFILDSDGNKIPKTDVNGNPIASWIPTIYKGLYLRKVKRVINKQAEATVSKATIVLPVYLEFRDGEEERISLGSYTTLPQIYDEPIMIEDDFDISNPICSSWIVYI